MPTYEVELTDGRVFQVDADQPPSEQDVLAALGGPAPVEAAPPSAGAHTAALAGLRALPAVGRAAGRFAANHPVATQKAIGAGITTAASGTGAAIGGVPGAVVGASIRGITPSQAAIRETAGRLAGETPQIASNAGRALGVQNFAKETAGLRVTPNNLVPTGGPTPAVDNYAKSMGQKVIRILDPYGNVAVGPEANAAAKAAKPGMLTKGVSRAASFFGPLLARMSGASAIGDLAQTAEPNRKDIGFLGVGKSQPAYPGDTFSQDQAAMRARILAMLGMGQ